MNVKCSEKSTTWLPRRRYSNYFDSYKYKCKHLEIYLCICEKNLLIKKYSGIYRNFSYPVQVMKVFKKENCIWCAFDPKYSILCDPILAKERRSNSNIKFSAGVLTINPPPPPPRPPHQFIDPLFVQSLTKTKWSPLYERRLCY